MSGQETPQHLAVMRVLEDGEWHTRGEVLRAATEAITPGIALRFAKERLQRAAATRQAAGAPGGTSKRWSKEELVRKGQRGLALVAINSSRRIEQEVDEDGTVWFRLLPPVVHYQTRKRLGLMPGSRDG